MKRIIEKWKNYHPSKWEALTYLLIPIFIGLLSTTSTCGDIWFILNTGRYILNHGFFSVDPFSMHEGLQMVVQQWLPDIIFYKSYEWLGKMGIYILVNLLNIYIVFITYKLLMLVSNQKRNLSVLVTCFITITFSLSFVTARPQMFSISILITELYFLEKYFKTNNYKYLISLPILSILMINMHASMWLMLFCFWAPFLLNTFKYNVGKLSSQKREKKYLLIFGILMFLAGFINPYGINAMTYVITSFGVPEINEIVHEMNAIDIHTILGKIIYMIIFSVYFIYLVFNKKNIDARHFYLLLGTTYLALSAYRGYAFFIIASIYPLAIYLNNKFYKVKEKNNKNWIITIIMCFFLVVLPFTFIFYKKYFIMENKYQTGIEYLLKTENKENIKLYCRYGECSSVEFFGIKPYLDSRAEIFIKANNKKEDILKEFFYLQEGRLYYKKFLEKYDFTHLIVAENDYLYPLMINDDDYEIIFSDNTEKLSYKSGLAEEEQFYYVIFKKIDKKN